MGKQIYLSEKEIEYLRKILDSFNAHEDFEWDEVRVKLFDKVSK
jgi:hypothetical protein